MDRTGHHGASAQNLSGASGPGTKARIPRIKGLQAQRKAMAGTANGHVKIQQRGAKNTAFGPAPVPGIVDGPWSSTMPEP